MRIGGGHLTLGGHYIGTAGDQYRRQALRQGGDCRQLLPFLLQTEFGRCDSQQSRQGVLLPGARCLQVVHFGTQRLALRLGLDHIGPGDDAGFILVAGQGRGAVIGRHGFVEDILLAIQRAQIDIGAGRRHLNGESSRGQVGGAGLQSGLVCFYLAAHPPPEIRRPANLQASIVLLSRRSPRVTTAAAAAAAHRSAYLGTQAAPGQPPLRLGSTEAGFGLGQGLVRLGAALHQRGQGIVLECQPPVAAGGPALRRHGLPAVLVADGGGIDGVRLDIVWPQGTAGQQHGKQGQR